MVAVVDHLFESRCLAKVVREIGEVFEKRFICVRGRVRVLR